jgi:hypothetical protein
MLLLLLLWMRLLPLLLGMWRLLLELRRMRLLGLLRLLLALEVGKQLWRLERLHHLRTEQLDCLGHRRDCCDVLQRWRLWLEAGSGVDEGEAGRPQKLDELLLALGLQRPQTLHSPLRQQCRLHKALLGESVYVLLETAESVQRLDDLEIHGGRLRGMNLHDLRHHRHHGVITLKTRSLSLRWVWRRGHDCCDEQQFFLLEP